MKIKFFVLLLSFISLTSSAQQLVKGIVVNITTGTPISGASVFISNTSTGTSTNLAGEFELNVPVGKNNLVVSCIGYETNLIEIANVSSLANLKIELTVKVKELQNVLLDESEEEGWNKWGKVFMDHFIGTTENAASCKILNEKAIRFRYFKRSNRLKAYADEPIIIENSALGYIIHYKLEDFEINFSEESYLYMGYALFEEMTSKRKGQIELWKQNRKKTYGGSLLHFMRSLYANKLVQNGFEVLRAVRKPNTEKERVETLYKTARAKQGWGTTEIDIRTVLSGFPEDTLLYYQNIMSQGGYTELLGRELLTADSVVTKKDDYYKILQFNDFLWLYYNLELPEEGYAKKMGIPIKNADQQSYMTLLNGSSIVFDKSGDYYDPRNLSTSVYWGWREKMANMLPVDYYPSASK